MKISKANMNYWVDLVIVMGFIVSAVSGLVLLFAPSGGGYQGGRNAAYAAEVLFLNRHEWISVHDWSSIAMVVGVFLHLVLHWKWITCMTRKIFVRGDKKSTLKACPNPLA